MATGQPVWAIATRFPRQGNWTEADDLDLPEAYPRVELSDGHLDVLPMPTDRHQAISTAMLLPLVAEAKRLGGWARPAGLRPTPLKSAGARADRTTMVSAAVARTS